MLYYAAPLGILQQLQNLHNSLMNAEVEVFYLFGSLEFTVIKKMKST